MRPSKNLKNLQYSTCKNLFRLHKIISVSSSRGADKEGEAVLSYVTIEMLNTWTNFSRAFYLSCILSPKTITSKRIFVGKTGLDFNQAIGLAIKMYTRRKTSPRPNGIWRRRDEPSWHIPKILIDMCLKIDCSNFEDIRAAFSAGFTVFYDLPVFRNFYAHRNSQTEKTAMNLAPKYGIPATLRPSQILLTRPLKRPQMLIYEWIDELIFTVKYLCD